MDPPEDVDQFALQATPEDAVMLDIRSKSEIVSSVFDATFTKTEAEQDAIYRFQWGDLPKDQWPKRKDQELAWVSGEVILLEAYSAPLRAPKSCVVVGVNNTVGIAIMAKNWGVTKGKDAEVKEPEKKEETEKKKSDQQQALEDGRTKMEAYARKNPIFAYKMALSAFECESFKRSLRYQIDTRIPTRKEAMAVMKSLLNLSKMDLSLRPAVMAIGPLLTDKINTMPETSNGPRGVRTAKRPGGMPGTHFTGYQFIELSEKDMSWDSATNRRDAGVSVFRIMMCTVPSVGEKKKKKAKQEKWRDINSVFVCRDDGVVPCVALNDTHMVVLYQPYDSASKGENRWPPGVIFVDLFDLSHPGTRVDRFAFVFPNEFRGKGLVHVTLSRLGVFAAAFSMGAVVFDVFRAVETPRIIALVHDESEEVDGKKKKKKKRRHRITCTSVNIVHPPNVTRPTKGDKDLLDAFLFNEKSEDDVPEVPEWCGHIMLGTHRGECFTFCWRTGAQKGVELLPGVHPVFASHYSNGRTILHAVDSMCGKICSVGPHTLVPLKRPLALTTCGSLIFVLSKYGEVSIFSSFARQFCRPFNPPPQGAGSSLLQHRYDGIWAGPRSVVVIYSSGMIRRISLPPPAK